MKELWRKIVWFFTPRGYASKPIHMCVHFDTSIPLELEVQEPDKECKKEFEDKVDQLPPTIPTYEVTDEEYEDLKKITSEPDSPVRMVELNDDVKTEEPKVETEEPEPASLEPIRKPVFERKGIGQNNVCVDKWYRQEETPEGGRLLIVKRITDEGNNFWLGFFQDGDFINLGARVPHDTIVSDSSVILNRAHIEKWAYYPRFNFV